MSLKPIIEVETEIPAALKDHYVKGTDGKWTIGLEGGYVPPNTLDEFRTNNRKLHTDKTALEERFKDVDPELFHTLKQRAELLDAKKLVSDGKVEQLIAERTAELKKKLEGDLTTTGEKLKAAEQQIATFMIDGALEAAGAKLGLLPTAKQDLLLRGRQVFQWKDGKVIGMNGDKERFSTTDPTRHESPEEWVAGLQKDAKHLFGANNGTGAGGSGSNGSTAGVKNPWKGKGVIGSTWNMTEQALLSKSDPSLAARLKAEAGLT